MNRSLRSFRHVWKTLVLLVGLGLVAGLQPAAASTSSLTNPEALFLGQRRGQSDRNRCLADERAHLSRRQRWAGGDRRGDHSRRLHRLLGIRLGHRLQLRRRQRRRVSELVLPLPDGTCFSTSSIDRMGVPPTQKTPASVRRQV